MMCLSGWQSVDLNFFKMFRSCLINRFLIETGNEMKRRLLVLCTLFTCRHIFYVLLIIPINPHD